MTFSSEAERLKDEVRRDLEWLLNTKRSPFAIPPGMVTLEQSVVSYGLPDFSNISPNDPAHRDHLVRVLESAIKNFEPRLFNVKVLFNPLDQDKSRASLHYRIDAMLHMDPTPESIVFDTILDLGSRAFIVRREGT